MNVFLLAPIWEKNVISDEDDEDENLDAEAIKEVTGDVEVHSHSDAHSLNLAL